MAAKCPHCGRKQTIKKGKRKTRYGKKQVYFCKLCRKRFTDREMNHRTYPPNVIYYSLLYYNLGYTLKETSKQVNKRFAVKTSPTTVHTWLKEFARLCPLTKRRKEILNGGKNPLAFNTFRHQDLEYKFMCHRPKLDRIKEVLPGLVDYVKKFETSCPDEFFHTEGRCSRPLFEVEAELEKTHNLLCETAEFAVKAARNNYQRHELVEKFLLANDLATVACEVPVWYWEKSVDRGITGHIDILQVRNGSVYIVDYKPKASKEKKAHRQLYHYASALSFRAGIPLDRIRCAYFDRNSCYEYSPSEAEARLVRDR